MVNLNVFEDMIFFLKNKIEFIKKSGLFVAVFFVYFYFGFFHLSSFITADENLWLYGRINKYWNALETGSLKDTMINDKPGVSLALISSPGYFFNRETIRSSIVQKYDGVPGGANIKRFEKLDANIQKNLFSLRLSILIFNGLFALFLFWLIKKITNDFWTAFWSFTLILTSPILLGISQIVNPDSLLWSFSTAALLSFLAFLKSEKKSFAILSSLSLRMALLSKYTATIFFPFFILVSFVNIGYSAISWKNAKEVAEKKIKETTIATLLIILGSILIYAIFMPAVFVVKDVLYESTIGFPGMKFFLWPLIVLQMLLIVDAHFFQSRSAIFVSKYAKTFFEKYSNLLYFALSLVFILILISWVGGKTILDFGIMRFDAGVDFKKFMQLPLYKKIIFEFLPLTFSLTPVVLVFMLFTWLRLFFSKSKFNFLIFTLSCFFVVFYAGVIYQNLLTTIRYTVLLYPLAAIIAAVGIRSLLSFRVLNRINKYAFSVILILSAALSLWLIKPFYFNYTSDLLPKNYIITGAWGYGGFEAAQFINNLPDSQNLVIWSDYPGACEFMKGKCYTTNKIPADTIDYYVLTRRGRVIYPLAKDLTHAINYYDSYEPIWTLVIGERPENFIKIFKNEER